MPIYSYRCKACLHTFEDLHKVDDRKIPESQPCPACEMLMTVEQSPNKIHISSTGGRTNINAPSDFKDLVKQIHKGAGRGSKIDI